MSNSFLPPRITLPPPISLPRTAPQDAPDNRRPPSDPARVPVEGTLGLLPRRADGRVFVPRELDDAFSTPGAPDPSLARIAANTGNMTPLIADAIPQASPQAAQAYTLAYSAAKEKLPDHVFKEGTEQMGQLFNETMQKNGGNVDRSLRACARALQKFIEAYYGAVNKGD